jgi:hypothetical protein
MKSVTKAIHKQIKRGHHEMQYFIDGVLYKTTMWTSKKHALKDAIQKGYEIHFA